MADKHKILIVEDDKYIINFISMSLKKEDYDYAVSYTHLTLPTNSLV